MENPGNCKGHPDNPGHEPPAGGGQRPYKPAKKPKRRTHAAYPPEVRLKAVRLHLEEGCTLAAVATELDVSRDVVYKWVRLYRIEGEAGLQPKPPERRAARLAPAP